MKRWTVMLIPHGAGSTRSLNLYSLQIWFVVLLFAGLSFTSAFLYQTSRSAKSEINRLEKEKLQIGLAAAPGPNDAGLRDDEKAAIEQALRTEYESRIRAITSELSELYDVETQLRTIHKLPPRTTAPGAFIGGQPQESNGGKGGPPSSGPDDDAEDSDDALMRPPSVTEGIYRPSADLIVQEINLRTASLRELIAASQASEERMERTPAIWPVSKTRKGTAGYISSRFGYRKDPFTRRLSFHSGLDIAAPFGSSVVATGAGKVVFSGWDKYLGNCVKIDHGDGIVTVYGHLQKTTVDDGEIVEKNEEVGKLGSTGRSTGAHVHYEVRKNGKAVNPEVYLRY